MAVDWLKIKNDYINGLGSYRKLAEQYGVPLRTIAKHAKDENWQEAKEKHCNTIATNLQQEIAAVIVQTEVKRVERLLSISDQLIDRIEQAVQELDQAQVSNKTKTKIIEYKDKRAAGKPTKEIIEEKEEILAVTSIVDRKGLQQVATALKAVWDITGESEADKENDIEDDGLLAALGANAQSLFDDGDDSGILPKEKEQ